MGLAEAYLGLAEAYLGLAEPYLGLAESYPGIAEPYPNPHLPQKSKKTSGAEKTSFLYKLLCQNGRVKRSQRFFSFKTFSEGENTRSAHSARPNGCEEETLGFGRFFSMKTVFFEVSFRVRPVFFDEYRVLFRSRAIFVDENNFFGSFGIPIWAWPNPFCA